MHIQPHQVHVWRNTFSDDQYDEMRIIHLLDEIEQERAKRFRFDIHRMRYVSTHYWLRNILSYYLQCEAKDIHFIKSSHGKPHIRFPITSLQFNLSHSENESICAIHSCHPLGIDIQQIKPTFNKILAQRYLTAQEYKILMACDNNIMNNAFYFFWAAKEAVIKAEGAGLLMQLKSFSIQLHESKQKVMGQDRVWQLISAEEPQGFKTALACAESVTEIIHYELQDHHAVIKKVESLTKHYNNGQAPEI